MRAGRHYAEYTLVQDYSEESFGAVVAASEPKLMLGVIRPYAPHRGALHVLYLQ